MILHGGDPVYPLKHEGVLAASLLTLALFNMPYGYFEFLRWLIMIIGISIAFEPIARRMRWLFFFGLSVAALFNPFVKVPFEREVWWWIDLSLACLFLYLGFKATDGTQAPLDQELIEGSLDGD